ncbi:MAG TPA: ketoacyl-ACP synthase III [Thermoanaerobacterales bacterium]|nr:ketoacyl-ACP synthase III [Thermoanaerobacterales bacterium]
MTRAGIIGTGSCVPKHVLKNSDLEKMVETTNEWIVTRTGIKQRHIANDGTACSDLATEAALKALQSANKTPDEIDLIIVATVTPDMNFPATACLVQKNIGANKSAAFDLESGCTGFLYGLTVASQFIMTGTYKCILVIGSEVLSKIVDWEDRNTCVLFGDGAGAVIVSNVNEGGILQNYLRADGTGGELLFMPGGGSRNPATLASVEEKMHHIKMKGNDVFKFAVRAMYDATENILNKAQMSIEDIDIVIPHQANKRIVNAAARRFKIPEEKLFINLDKYGNMSGASIPVALDEAFNEGRIKKYDNILLVGFGAGLTWGSCIINWNY